MYHQGSQGPSNCNGIVNNCFEVELVVHVLVRVHCAFICFVSVLLLNDFRRWSVIVE